MKTKNKSRPLAKVKAAIPIRKPKPNSVPARIAIVPSSKVYVDNQIALGVATCFSCLRVVSETIGILTWRQYEFRENGRGRDVILGDNVDRVIRVSPNPEMTPIDWRVAMVMCAMLSDAYSVIERTLTGEAVAMWPIHPSRVCVKRSASDQLYYEVLDDNGVAVGIPAADMFHIKGPTFDGMTGHKIIDAARESFGLTLATERSGAAFYGNAMRPSGVVEVPEAMSDKAYRRFRKAMQELYAGVNNVGRIAILEEGAVFKATTVHPDEAQHLETRKHQIREVCRWFRVPPHKVADLEDAHFTNIEHQEIEYVTDTILPWVVRFEQEANRKLISPALRERRYTKMNVDGLLRGDSKSRNEAYKIAREAGFRSANEIRAFEDDNPIDEPWADKYWMPLNYMYADEPRPEAQRTQGTSNDEQTQTTQAIVGMISMEALRPAAMKLIRGALDTAWRKEDKARTRAMKNDGFSAWAVQFYAEQCDYIESLLVNVADALMQGLRTSEQTPRTDTLCRVIAERYTVDAQRQENASWVAWAEQRRATDTADLVDQLFALAVSGSN